MAQSPPKSAPLAAVLDAIETIAPLPLAEPWDKVGLHVGNRSQRITRALLCIDLTEPVLDEAAKRKAQLIIAYHPVIFTPVDRLTDATWQQRVLIEAVRRNIAVYCPHTALDAAKGGPNDSLAQGLGKGTLQPLTPTPAPGSSRAPAATAAGDAPATAQQYKLVVFVPEADADALRARLSDAGAGVIGNYTQCSFGSAGQGTFLGGAGSNPAVGRAGQLERVAELRMEMVVPAAALPAAIETLRKHHPYEEPAFDVYRLTATAGRQADDDPAATGAGRLLTLDKPATADALVHAVKRRLALSRLRVARPPGADQVRTVAVCVGAGGSLFEHVEADAYVTGEMRHHDVLDLTARGKLVILAGHTHTERPYLPTYRQRLADACATARLPAIDWHISEADRAPWQDR